MRVAWRSVAHGVGLHAGLSPLTREAAIEAGPGGSTRWTLIQGVTMGESPVLAVTGSPLALDSRSRALA